MSAREHSAGLDGRPASGEGESARVTQARLHARERVRRQRDTLRALGLGAIAGVILNAVDSKRPRPP